MLRMIFAQDTPEAAHEQGRKVADGLRERFARVAELMDGAEHDVLAHRAFPKEHWALLVSTNPSSG
jgi:transposase-like protein